MPKLPATAGTLRAPPGATVGPPISAASWSARIANALRTGTSGASTFVTKWNASMQPILKEIERIGQQVQMAGALTSLLNPGAGMKIMAAGHTLSSGASGVQARGNQVQSQAQAIARGTASGTLPSTIVPTRSRKSTKKKRKRKRGKYVPASRGGPPKPVYKKR